MENLILCKDFPYIVDLYKQQLKNDKYIPRLYRSHSQKEVKAILSWGMKRKDRYLRLTPRDLGFIYADADRRSDDEQVRVADWIMTFIEGEKPWNSLRCHE